MSSAIVTSDEVVLRHSRFRGWAYLSGLATIAAAATIVVIVGFLVMGVAGAPIDLKALLTSSVWDPSRGSYGGAAMIFGTVAVSMIALGIAGPIGRSAALAITEIVPPRLAGPLRTAAEFLAVIPSIVYGLVGIAVMRPLVSGLTGIPGGDGLLTAGLVLAVMVLPTLIAVSVDALDAVPQETREAARSLGLLEHEVRRRAVIPAARSGLRAASLLGLARALGETIAVYLLIGRADGRLPDPTGVLSALVRPGQAITTKLGGPEPVLSGGRGEHWSALCALGLLLLVIVAVLTVTATERSSPRGARPRLGGHRSLRSLAANVVPTIHGRGVVPRALSRRSSACRIEQALRVAAVLGPVVVATGIASLVLARGTAALDPSFWWSSAVGADGGGVRDQLAGTLLLTATAALIAMPLALGIGLALAEYSGPRPSRYMHIATVTLGGVPSILLGFAGYRVFSVGAGMGKSWLVGSLLLALIILPVAALAVAAQIEAVPAEQREAAAALGLRQNQLVTSVIWPRARVGLITGTFLGTARAAGETAPLLFAATVFAGAPALPQRITDAPVQTLPTHLFTLSQDAARPEAQAAAWGSAVVLMIVVAVLLATAARFRRRTNHVYLAPRGTR